MMLVEQTKTRSQVFPRNQIFLRIFLGLCIAGTITAAPKQTFAQSLNTPLGGFAKDNKAPIDIEADELEIRQKENIAIFSGKVNVVQGKFRLQSSKLVVRYTAAGKTKNSKREIEKLNATGGVIVTSDTQSATGDWATMDMKTNIIIMGDNVVISQGDNVIRGSKVMVDLNTGYSRILSDKKKGGRIRAIFKSKKK